MKVILSTIIVFFFLNVLVGCSGISIHQYANNEPKLNLFEYFAGTTKGWGIVQDRSGRLTRQFTVLIDGSIDSEGNLVLDEDFIWSDGEESKRTWTISRTDIQQYSGTAADVIDSAEGKSAGNVLNWSYVLNLEVDGSFWKIDFDDWMFLQEDNILINKASMSKFGFRVGDITIVFSKTI